MTEKMAITFRTPASVPLLELVEPTVLFDEIDRIHNTIARRAFEIFEQEGGLFGRDLEHWLKAENEFLYPMRLSMEETGKEFVVKAEVPGFSADKLKVSLEPRKLVISGKREMRKADLKGKKPASEAGFEEILRTVELPAEVDVVNSVAVLRDGILDLKMPKIKTAKVVEIKVA